MNRIKISAALALTIGTCQGLEIACSSPDRHTIGALARLVEKNTAPVLTSITAQMDDGDIFQTAKRMDPIIARISEGRDVPWIDCVGLSVALMADFIRDSQTDEETRLAINATLNHLKWIHWWMATSPEHMARDPTLGEQWKALLN